LSTDEFDQVVGDLTKTGRRFWMEDFTGIVMDGDFALTGSAFSEPEVEKTYDLKRLVTYRCQPDWDPETTDEVVARLEECWLEQVALRNEVHAITIGSRHVVYDFATWRDDGTFCTGRVEVDLPSRLHHEE
jgi:hypothetical protein